jgi:hypothetical protein
MAVFLSPVGGVAAQFFTNTGAVLTGGKIYTYAAGTTTPAVTYTNSGGGTFHTNPIVLDAAGRISGSGEVWLGDAIQYKFVLKDSNDVLIATYDNISGINSNFTNFLASQEIQTATAGQTVFTLANPYVPGANTLSVFVDGVNQYGPGATYAYTETNTNTVTFVSGLHVGASVKFTTAQSLTSTQATDASLVSYTPPGTGAVVTTVQAKLRQYISVKDFGAVGNSSTDDTAAIQLALNYAGSVNGCTVYFPDGIYKVTDVLLIKNNTTLEFAGSIKVYAMPTGGYEAVLATDPPTGASNITILNPQIDLNSIVPASGILIRYASQNVRIEGGYIRNGLNSVTYSGGRGINIEGGDTPTDVTVSGTTIENCWEGVSLTGGTGQEASNISISNLTINYCQSAIGLSGNAPTYPHTGAYMQGLFNNISIRNCGVVTTYSRQAGVINSNRGCNVMFNNIYIYNNPAYGNPDSLWRGDAYNINMTNVTMEGNLGGSMFNFSSYQESNSFPLSTYSSSDSRFLNVKQIGTTPEIIVLPIVGASYLTNCQFDVVTDVVTSDSPINTNLNNKTDVFIRAQNKTSNSIISGYCADISQYSNDFANWPDQEIDFSQSGAAKGWALINGTTGAVVRAFNMGCTRSSTGQYAVTITNPLPTVNYVVLVQATAPNATAVQADQVSSKTGSGFTLQTSSAGTLVDKTLINISVYY